MKVTSYEDTRGPDTHHSVTLLRTGHMGYGFFGALEVPENLCPTRSTPLIASSVCLVPARAHYVAVSGRF